MGSNYNGYTWQQRMAAFDAFKQAISAGAITHLAGPCAVCGDPHRNPTNWHSEDYSLPYSFGPPQSWPVCDACHPRLHKRFGKPLDEWHLFLVHLEHGGYGREFVRAKSGARRLTDQHRLAKGEPVDWPMFRARTANASDWWRDLTLDPESLVAPWARSRPLRPRPDQEAFACALNEVRISDRECRMLRAHAAAPRRSATMRTIACAALGSDEPGAANLAYGGLAHRLADATGWSPDQRKDHSPVWMSVVGEGWQPETREYEWVMVPTLAAAICASG